MRFTTPRYIRFVEEQRRRTRIRNSILWLTVAALGFAGGLFLMSALSQ